MPLPQLLALLLSASSCAAAPAAPPPASEPPASEPAAAPTTDLAAIDLSALSPGDTFEMGGITFVMAPPIDCSGVQDTERQICRLSERDMPTFDALVAQGPAVIPALEATMLSPEITAPKTQAALVLRKLGAPAIPALVRVVTRSRDSAASRAATEALVSLGEPALAAVLRALEAETGRLEQGNLTRALAAFGAPAVPHLVERIDAGGIQAFHATLVVERVPPEHRPALEGSLVRFYQRTSSTIDRGEVLRGLALIGSPEARALLAGALADPDRSIRTSAALALTRMEPAYRDTALQQAMVAGLSDPETGGTTALALQRIGAHDAAEITALREAIRTAEPAAAGYLGAALAEASSEPEAATIAHLIALYPKADDRGKKQLARAFRFFGPRAAGAAPLLGDVLRTSGDRDAATAAAEALGAIGPDGVRVLDAVLTKGGPRSELAAEGLKHLDPADPAAVALLRKALAHTNYVGVTAMNAAAAMDPTPPEVVQDLIASLDTPRAPSAASVLGDIGSPAATPAVPALIRLQSADRRIAWQATHALVKIGTPEAMAAVEAAAALPGQPGKTARSAWADALQELRPTP